MACGCPLASRDRAGNPARSQQRRPCWNQRPRHCLQRQHVLPNALPAALPDDNEEPPQRSRRRPSSRPREARVCTRWHHLRPIAPRRRRRLHPCTATVCRLNAIEATLPYRKGTPGGGAIVASMPASQEPRPLRRSLRSPMS